MSRTKSALTGWPADFTLTDALATWAKERGFDAANEFEEFKEWADANGARYADWAAAFRYRLRNKLKWAAERGHSVNFNIGRTRIGFTAPKIQPEAVRAAIRENEIATQETATLTPEQRDANRRRLAEIAGRIK